MSQDADVLRARARALARPLVTVKPVDERELLVFDLADERYAIETRFVREVMRTPHLSAVPSVGAVVAGLAGLRGEILPVFDLRALFGLAPGEATPASRVIVLARVEKARAELGVRIDAARDVVQVEAHDIVDGGGALARGITRSGLVVLDGEALLTDARLYVDQTEDT